MSRPPADLRARLHTGETLLGTFCTVPDPAIVEMTAAAGFDFVCIDTEHAPTSRGVLESLIRAAEVTGRPALVRVADNRPELVGAALDGGAAGVIVPGVDTASDARRAVRATRYPPLGARGGYPGRASGYNRNLANCLARANDELLLVAQVESPAAVAAAREIAAVDGIDALYAAPGDLSVALGAGSGTGTGGGEPVEALRSVVQAARDEGRSAGLFQPGPERVGEWLAHGAGFFLLGADALFLTSAADATVRAARAVNSSRAGAVGAAQQS
ncbi:MULTISPECIES: aldolase/citrate lyase family protein [unclassified Streptomyces]|uniref:HpcH/HpaI aldolase family protein n=1 Tax=unclassified Streptomyces TaxID=2593676 RepID=UPI002E264004